MPHRDQGSSCVFCGRKPLTKEHIFPERMRKLLPDQGEGTHRRKLPGETEEHAYRGPPINESMRVVCGPECNHGWMAALEDEAEPYLTTMIVGHGREFHKTGRGLIAEWTYKTALIFGTALKDNPPPLSYYRDFYRERVLPPGAGVWFGLSASALMYYRQMRSVIYDFDDDTQGEGWMATLSVGYMVAHVVWLERGEQATLQVQGELAEALRQVWPTDGRAIWPPPISLDEARLDRICNSYGGAF